MQVNAISVSNPSFRASEREKQFAALDDAALRTLAWNKASVDVNDKRHNRLDKAMYLSLPIVGGISTLVHKLEYEPIKDAIINVPSNKIRTAKLARAGRVAGAWAVALGAVSALWGAKDFAEKSVKSVKEFSKDHPVLTTMGAIAASFGAVVFANRVSYKAMNKFLFKDAQKAVGDFSKLTKLDKALNNSKILNSAEKFIKKMPPVLKEIGKNVVDFLPWIVIGTQITHSWGHQSAKLEQANKNYAQMKTAQEMIRQDIADEKIDEEISA